MRKVFENKWILPILFGFTLLFNGMVYFGLIGLTQQQVSDKYANLFAPSSITFSIWSIIYIGVALSIYLEFKNSYNQLFMDPYITKVKPFMMVWMVMNILWNILWATESLKLSLVVILIYLISVAILSWNVHQEDYLYNERLFLRWPVGLHLGWMIVAFFANGVATLNQMGLDTLGTMGLIVAITSMVLVLVIAVMIASSHANFVIMLPVLWAIGGILLNHLKDSEFMYRNDIMYYASIGLLGLGVFLLIAMLFRGDTSRYS